MESKNTIFYVYPRISSFIRSDIEGLSETYNVLQNTYNWANKILVPFYLLSQFLYFLFNIRKGKCVIVSFAGYWSLAPAILGKIFKVPVYIILNGTDCSSIPELNYGSLRKPLQKKIIEWSCSKSTCLLPVSKSLVFTTNNFNTALPKNQGISHYFPKLNTPIKIIPNGFDIKFWMTDEDKVSNLFLSVISESQFYLKGGDLIIDVAKKQPKNSFVIVGCNAPNIELPSNVTFAGFLAPQELRKMYSKAKYYMQLSSFEGFGCSLAEAMLCGCIPIVSDVNSMPEIIGETGYILKQKDLELLSELLNSIINNNSISSDLTRNRVKELYPISRRIEEIEEIIQS